MISEKCRIDVVPCPDDDYRPYVAGAKAGAIGWALEDRTPLCFNQVNPKRKDSQSNLRYEKYKRARTYGEYKVLNPVLTQADLRNDLSKGYLDIPGYESLVPPRPPPMIIEVFASGPQASGGSS